MKSPFLNEVLPDQLITTSLLVHSKEVRQKKKGEPYLALVLGDRSGEMDAKMWDNVTEVMDSFQRDDFVKVKGLIQIYNNKPQLIIHKMRRLEENEVDLADYFPASRRDSEEMFRELNGIIAGIGNPHLKRLLELFFADQEIAARYKRAPAAKHIHHAFLGGLLEHVLSLCSLCRMAAQHYGAIDIDLLLSGAILHDIGKIHELNYDRGFSYSSEGQLLGHIVIGLHMMADKIREIPEFPSRLRNLLEHMIISHHGQLEFGSPRVPLFAEALLLHYLDDMDSKMECVRAMVEQDRHVDGEWTSFSSSLERVILKKLKYLGGCVPEEVEQEIAPAAPRAIEPVVQTPPPPSQQAQAPKQSTMFAEKLQQALHREE